MTKYVHDYHTAYEFQRWKPPHCGIVLIRKTGGKFKAREVWSPVNWRFKICPNRLGRWHWFIRLPLFLFERDNCGFKIGTQNSYLWVIK
jgi:hypothetical protein